MARRRRELGIRLALADRILAGPGGLGPGHHPADAEPVALDRDAEGAGLRVPGDDGVRMGRRLDRGGGTGGEEGEGGEGEGGEDGC